MADTRTRRYQIGDPIPAPTADVRMGNYNGGKDDGEYLVIDMAHSYGSYRSLNAGGLGAQKTMPWFDLAIAAGLGCKARITWRIRNFVKRVIVDWGQCLRVWASTVEVDLVFPLALVPLPREFKVEEVFSCCCRPAEGGEGSALAVLTEGESAILGNVATRPGPIPWNAQSASLYASRNETDHNGQSVDALLLLGHWNGAVFRPFVQARYTGDERSPVLPIGASSELPILPGAPNARVVQNEGNATINYRIVWNIKTS